MGAVHTAAKRSPRSRDGTTITRSGGRMAAVTPRTIGCCSTRPATVKCTMPAVQRVYRILSQGCFERLEPDIGKLICPVLRGGVDGNAAPLLDTMKLTVLGQYGKGLVQCEAALGEEIRDKIGGSNGRCGMDRSTKRSARSTNGDLDRALQRDVCPVHSLGQGVIGIAYVYCEQSALDTELRAAVSPGRGDCDRFRGVHGAMRW